jgi:hypothetical protein
MMLSHVSTGSRRRKHHARRQTVGVSRIRLGVLVENARVILGEPAFTRPRSEMAISWARSLAVLPLSLTLAWFVFGPSRLVLNGDQLLSVNRVRTYRVSLPRLKAVSVDHGLRTGGLVLRDDTELGVSLHNLSDETEPLRHLLGVRLTDLKLGHLVRGDQTRTALGLC